MKKIIISVAVIAAIGLIVPKFTGGFISQGLDDFIGTINEMPGYQANIEKRETNWFSSSAVINVGIDPAMFADLPMGQGDMEMFENFAAKINFSAQHGPFLTLNGLGLGLSAWKADVDESVLREYLSYAEGEKFYSVVGNIGFFGGISYEDIIPAFNVIVDEAGLEVDEAMSFSGWNGKGTASSSQANYAGEMDTLVASGAGMTFEMKSVSIDMSIEGSWADAIANVFYDSSSQFAIESINFDMPLIETKALIKNVVIDASTEKSEDGKLMDMDINYSTASIDIPQFQGRNLLMKMEINNLEKDFLKTYQEASTKPAQMQQAMADMIKNNLLAQLQVSPEINITEMSGKVADGNFSGKMLAKLTSIDSLPQSLEDPAFWMSKAVVDSQLTLDKAMALWLGEQVVTSQLKADPNAAQMTDEEIQTIAAQQVESMIDMFTQQGMITVNADGGYDMTFSMQDSQALLNGNPMPLPF
ncbi:MAG: hypothetical protein ACI97K_003036 [Glaciecola sp.]|jgi:uncharacterized protein YdgA (DUF945 family)